LPEELSSKTLQSLLNQTVPLNMIVVMMQHVPGSNLGRKVSFLFNKAMSRISFQEYDYILRVDGDVILPSNYLEKNMELHADVVGTGGYAMLLKTSTFKKIMDGKLHRESDDSYLFAKFKMLGCIVKKPIVDAYHVEKNHKPFYYLERGRIAYQVGYEPLHMFYLLVSNWRNIITLYNYFSMMIQRKNKFDVANYIKQYQIHRLLRGIKNAFSWNKPLF
jgi:hypothetical protein